VVRSFERFAGAAAIAALLYLGRLIVLDAASPVIAIPALLAGPIVSQLRYGWIGLVRWNGDERERSGLT
jgi:hypothetical protein